MVGTPLNELWKMNGRKAADKLIDKFAKIFLIFLAIALALSMAASGIAAEPIRLTPIETYDVAENTSETYAPIVLKPILVNMSGLNETIPPTNISVANISLPINVSIPETTINVSTDIIRSNKTISTDTIGIYPIKSAKVEGGIITVGRNVTWSASEYGDEIIIPQIAYGLILPEIDNETRISSGRMNITVTELKENMERLSKINAYESELKSLNDRRLKQNLLGRVAIDLNSFAIENSIKSEKEQLLNLTESIVIKFKTNATRTVQYITEAPKKTETNITAFRKYVNISSIMHYANVTAYTILNTEVSKNKIEIFWIINGTRIPFKASEHTISYIDSNSNGLIDRIEWIVPHLSSQVFEIITRMNSVYDMDESKNPLSDIYSLVKTIDNVTAEIVDTHHIGITFEKPLDSSKKIILYANSSSVNTTLFLYDGSKDAIAVLRNVSAYGRYELSLENMSSEVDQFYIKIVNGTLYVDYITSYPPTGNASIWDDTNDAEGKNETYYENELVGFYANMTNATGQPINGSTNGCWIAFNISGGWSELKNMTFNGTSGLYQYFTNFTQAGTSSYNVTCYSGSGSAVLSDNFTITRSMPNYTIARTIRYNSTIEKYNVTLVITSSTAHRYNLKVYDYLEKGLIGENYSITPTLVGNYTDGMYDGRYAIWHLPLTAYENKTITYLARINASTARTDILYGMG